MSKLFLAFAIFILIHFKGVAQTSNDSLWYNLGANCYLQLKFDEAAFWFSKSIEVGYKVALSYAYKAGSEMLIGKLDDANADLDAGLRADSSECWVYFFKARLYFAQEESDSSIFWGKKAALAQPSVADFNDGLALAYNQKKIMDSALKYENYAVTQAPNDPTYVGNYGYIKMNMGKYNEALIDFKFALELSPGDANTLTNTAYCNYKLKAYAKALQICNDVLIKNPNFPYAYVVRAQIKYDTGQKKDACDDFKRVSLIKITEKAGLDYLKQYGCPVNL